MASPVTPQRPFSPYDILACSHSSSSLLALVRQPASLVGVALDVHHIYQHVVLQYMDETW